MHKDDNNLPVFGIGPVYVLSCAVLTVVLKRTEERWLLEKFGDEYACYCKRVNRIIPWFSFAGHNK